MSDPDLRLVRRAGRGDRRAFARLYERYRSRLLGYLVRILGDRSLAEDVFQEVWIKVFRKIDRFRPETAASFKSWLFRVAGNAAVDRLRHEARHAKQARPDPHAEEDGAPLERLPSPGPDPERTTGGKMLGDLIRDALAGLPERQRIAVLLRHQQGLSYAELAGALEVPEGTAKTLVHRGVLALREQLTEWTDD